MFLKKCSLETASRSDKQSEVILQQFPLQCSIQTSPADEILDQQQTPEQDRFSVSQNATSVGGTCWMFGRDPLRISLLHLI